MGVVVATVEDEGEDTYYIYIYISFNILLTAISNITFRCAFLPLYPFDNDI